MATPTPTAYSVPHGVTALGGRTSGVPAWAASAQLNTWIAVPGTNGTASMTAGVMPQHPASPGYCELNAWGGWCHVPGVGLVVAAPGGHSDGYDNSVVKCQILADSPAWVQLCTKSSSHVANDGAYEPDGKPMSRHNYYALLWSSALNRVMMIGMFGTIPNGYQLPTVDGFSLATNTWDPAGTYPDTNSAGGSSWFGTVVDEVGDIWNIWGEAKFSATTKTWSRPRTQSSVNPPRYPWALDTKRNQRFGMCYGDGMGASVNLGLCATKQVGNVQTDITFNSSPALSQFIADAPAYIGMAYVPERDSFLAYSGVGATVGRFYEVIPNASAKWDMAFFTPTAGGVTLPATYPAGICSRFTYIPELKGIAMMPDGRGDIYFMRTA